MNILHFLKITLLGLWAFFFCWLATLGKTHLARLLHPDLWWLVIGAAVILLLFLAVNLKRQVAKKTQLSLGLQWPSLAILLLPLFYFTHTQSARFNSSTFAKRSLQTEDGFLQWSFDDKVAAKLRAYEEENKEVSLTKLFLQTKKYTGKEVEVVCQSFVDKRIPGNHLACYRYLITCCAADARPIFVFVEPSEGTTIENDKWIKVRGTMGVTSNSDIEIPIITADSILYVEEPTFPYAF